MDSILYFYQYTIYFYTLALTAFYLFLMISSYFMIERIKVRYTKIEADLLLDLPEIAPPISIVAPAYNEEVIIIDNVNSLLSMNYPNFEVISHSLTSRHFQFFVKNIPIKEQADKV